ncbi:DUF5688 family protein [Lachnospiraceae bacterium 66-29]
MTYDFFKQQLMDSLREFFPADTQIVIRPFPHNNQLILDGLTILEPGSNISPTIYLNFYFEKYQKGMNLSTIEQQILQYYHRHCPINHIDTSFFTDYNRVRSRIVYRLVHYEKNRELLKEIPHFPYLDLAVIFYCLVAEEPYENASILIYNHHLAYWKLQKETLRTLAQTNTPLLLPWRCDSLAELIMPALDVLPVKERPTQEALLDAETIPMYVLSNEQRYFGASCILYPNALKEISQKFADSLFILPSSIHEVIIIPASYTEDANELSEIVHDVNVSEVAQDEILSDSVYFYDQNTEQLSIISGQS